MIYRTATLVLFIIGTLLSPLTYETVKFRITPSRTGGYLPRMEGKLKRPQGNDPFPAVVLIPGSSGICRYHYTWLERVASWGYVALLVDSIGTRQYFDPHIDPFLVSLQEFVQDAYDAKTYLAGLSFVDKSRIAVMGWEEGGWAILTDIRGLIPIEQGGDSFRAAITIYPYCEGEIATTNSPLLILMGEKDRWCPPERCWIASERKSPHEVILRIYPGTYHAFDAEGTDKMLRGHRLRYDPESANDAIDRVKKFLLNHLK